MAGIGVGMEHADRSRVEPAYLLNGDPGYSGGGTTSSSETNAMMSNYENVFGPAARDIKWDAQRHKRHQRWHLPDALKGANTFLTDRIDGLITDATSSPFTKNILPYLYMENPDQKIKWNVYSFDEGMASRVPYESAARVLPQSKRSFAGYAVRQGLAIAMEHNFMMSPQGMENFRRQLMQLVGSIQLTNDLDVHMALLYAPSYQKHMDEKYWDGSKPLTQQCRMYVDLFGFVQKNENALDYLIEDAKNHLAAWGSKPPTFMLCNGALSRQLTMTPERTNYITAGPDGKRKLAQGPDLPSYRGLSIINTRQFSLEAGSAPRDMLRRRVRVSEHYRIPWEINNMRKRFEFYDQSRDSMFYLSWMDLWKASFPATAENLLPFSHHAWPKSQLAGQHDDREECRRTLGPDGFGQQNNARDYITQAQDGRLRSTMFSNTEILLGALLGIWSPMTREDGHNHPIEFMQDLEFVCRVINQAGAGGRPTYATVVLPKSLTNKKTFFHLMALLVVKKFMQVKFPEISSPADVVFDADQVAVCTNLTAIFNRLINCRDSPTVHNILEKVFEAVHRNDWPADYQSIVPAIKDWSLGTGAAGTTTIEVECLAADLFLLRPNIEHYMLGVILGRGGGPEELGATFWGQTELSCYDDSQHGIWGMSYKYHERAIVINERNLIRVFDVCFDGYCGGNDARILKWNTADLEEFRNATQNLSTAYSGPSMVVMSLPRHTDVYNTFPNPVVWHPKPPHPSRMRVVPDRGGAPNQLNLHCPFADQQKLTTHVYSMYYQALGLTHWSTMHTPLDPGHLAYANETDPYVFSFHGHMTQILDGQREETQGSGHLGSNFVGVASVREGRGMLPRGMPTLAHLV